MKQVRKIWDMQEGGKRLSRGKERTKNCDVWGRMDGEREDSAEKN